MTNTLIPATARRLPYFVKASTKFEEPVSVEQAFSQSQMRWEVEQRPVFFNRADNVLQEVERHSAIVRSDTLNALGVVGARYTEIQNSQVEQMIDGSGFKVEALGEIDDGRKCYAVLDTGPYSSFNVGGDPWNSYLIVRWNHDGTGALKWGVQLWRQWCTNGSQHVAGFKWESIRHTASSGARLIEAEKVLPEIGTTIETFVAKTIQLQKRQIDRTTVNLLLDELWPKPQPEGSTVQGHLNATTRWENKRATFNKILRSDSIREFSNTAHGFVQAVNELEQWYGSSTRDRARSQIGQLDAGRFPATEKALVLVGG